MRHRTESAGDADCTVNHGDISRSARLLDAFALLLARLGVRQQEKWDDFLLLLRSRSDHWPAPADVLQRCKQSSIVRRSHHCTTPCVAYFLVTSSHIIRGRSQSFLGFTLRSLLSLPSETSASHSRQADNRQIQVATPFAPSKPEPLHSSFYL